MLKREAVDNKKVLANNLRVSLGTSGKNQEGRRVLETPGGRREELEASIMVNQAENAERQRYGLGFSQGLGLMLLGFII